MTKEREALKLALEFIDANTYGGDDVVQLMTTIREALAEQPAPQQEPVAWRDHVEQRLLTWRQSFVNKSGDQLALDDFMDKRSLDDLIDFVCSEYTSPPAQRKPLTDEEIKRMAAPWFLSMYWPLCNTFARAIEAAHGITGEHK